MNKKKFHKMLVLGISSAACITAPAFVHAAPRATSTAQNSPLTPAEDAFAQRLNAAMNELFTNMSSDDRKTVMKMAEMKCAHNPCAQLGGCKTRKHACKGQNECKNQGGCRLSPNEAVKLLDAKQNAKRAKVL